MTLRTFYKSVTNRTIVWEIKVVGNRITTYYGKTPTDIYAEPSNVGTKNELTAEKQAHKKAVSLINAKLKKGYQEDSPAKYGSIKDIVFPVFASSKLNNTKIIRFGVNQELDKVMKAINVKEVEGTEVKGHFTIVDVSLPIKTKDRIRDYLVPATLFIIDNKLDISVHTLLSIDSEEDFLPFVKTVMLKTPDSVYEKNVVVDGFNKISIDNYQLYLKGLISSKAVISKLYHKLDRGTQMYVNTIKDIDNKAEIMLVRFNQK